MWAWCEGMRALGHELDAWIWFRSSSSPEGPVPSWCRYEPFDAGPMWKRHMRSLVHPRGEIARAGWEPPSGAVAIADHYSSFAAVTPFPRSVATLHFRTLLDAWAVRRFELARVQTARAEWAAGRRAGLVLAYSKRIARHLRHEAHVVPIAYPVPDHPLAPVDSPVAAMFADWSWPPNQWSLKWLLKAWPEVKDAVPTAKLLLAGRRLDQMGIGSVPGVTALGEVGESTDVLGQASVLAFPCPSSSGPKVKVLEALSYGIPVVTTPAGIEGVFVSPGEGAAVARLPDFAATLAKLLVDPQRRSALGTSGRLAVTDAHSPIASARARIAAITDAFGE